MDFLVMHQGFPLLSALIFLPLAGAVIGMFLPSESSARVWALLVTIANALLSIPLYTGFDPSTAKFQFGEHHPWIPIWHINYTLGVDGISLLLILLTTLIMPFCVLASWRYIAKRVKAFMV